MAHIHPPFWHPACAGGFILDWDGVLAETKLSFAPIREKYFGGRMVPLVEAGLGLSPDRREQLEADIYRIEMEGAATAYPVEGAHDLIRWLGRQGKPWCVVSRNCLDSIRLASSTAGIVLPAVVRSRDIEPVKPDPKALWAAADAMGIPYGRCVMVGDFVYDLLGARRAGMRAVLVQHPEAEWRHWADVAFDRLTDFVAALHSPEPLVPWEYAALSAERGAGALAEYREYAVRLDGEAPDVLPLALRLAGRGILHFQIAGEHHVTARQWRLLPGLEPDALDRPVGAVLARLLSGCFPMAQVHGTDGEVRPTLSAVDADALLSGGER